MSKAEQRAYEAYPVSFYEGTTVDVNEIPRYVFIDGYHQAEKDNELTWEDMRELHIIFAKIDVDIELCKTDIKAETLGYYEEVLKRFKNLKK